MLQLESIESSCPYCGEPVTVEVEREAGSHAFIEDCPVCCCPIEYRVERGPTGEISLQTLRDDEA